jgi:hypothetical protein
MPPVSAEEPGIAYTHTYRYYLASPTLQLTPAGIMAVARFYIAHESFSGMKGFAGIFMNRGKGKTEIVSPLTQSKGQTHGRTSNETRHTARNAG